MHQTKQMAGGFTALKQWHFARLMASPCVIGMGRRPGYVLLGGDPEFGGLERSLQLPSQCFLSLLRELSEQVASPGCVWRLEALVSPGFCAGSQWPIIGIKSQGHFSCTSWLLFENPSSGLNSYATPKSMLAAPCVLSSPYVPVKSYRSSDRRTVGLSTLHCRHFPVRAFSTSAVSCTFALLVVVVIVHHQMTPIALKCHVPKRKVAMMYLGKVCGYCKLPSGMNSGGVQ